MNEIETFEFDRQGYIVIEKLLNETQVAALAEAVDELEEHALAHVTQPPRKQSGWGANYHANPERGYHANGERAEGKTLMVEDFWNANPAFDVLLDHPPTMDYIHGIVKQRPTINNSEIPHPLSRQLHRLPRRHRLGQSEVPLQLHRARHRLHDGADGLFHPRLHQRTGGLLRGAGDAQDQPALAPQQRPGRRPRHDRPRGQGRRRDPLHRKLAPRRPHQPL